MPNRSASGLPVIYVEAKPSFFQPTPPKPHVLDLFDVPYLHFHSLIELGLCLSGKGVCFTEQGQQPFEVGDVQIIFPFQGHLSKSTGDEPSRWCWLNIDPVKLLSAGSFTNIGEIEQWLREEMGLSGIIDRQRYPEVYRLTKALVREGFFPTPGRPHREEYVAALFLMLLSELCRISRDLPKLSFPKKNDRRILSPAFDSIKADIDGGRLPVVSRLPGLCSMSPASFRRTFKAAVGQSAKDYSISCVIRRACQLLSTTEQKIIQVSESVGFESISGFNRCFLRLMGMTPRVYRRRVREFLADGGAADDPG